jgi:hypothetical protein
VRAHGVARSAWWFDSGPHGRFNLSAPRGTCYAATELETAVRERVRDEVSATGVVSRALADSFAVSTIAAPDAVRCAAVSAKRAVDHGVVRELVTTDDYETTREWATAFDANGFDGVFYGSAYTTGAPSAVALFGDAGEPATGSGFAAAGSASGADACRAAGLTVAGPPAIRALTII